MIQCSWLTARVDPFGDGPGDFTLTLRPLRFMTAPAAAAVYQTRARVNMIGCYVTV